MLYSVRAITVLIVLSICSLCCAEMKSIKIVEGVDRPQDSTVDAGQLTAEPDKVYGPEALRFLQGKCFDGRFDRFDYTVCPFHSIAQRRINGQRATSLGVWGYWVNDDVVIDNGQGEALLHNKMKYVDGKSCGSGKITTVLELRCEYEGDFTLISVKEESFCYYSAVLGMPISCGLLMGN